MGDKGSIPFLCLSGDARGHDTGHALEDVSSIQGPVPSTPLFSEILDQTIPFKLALLFTGSGSSFPFLPRVASLYFVLFFPKLPSPSWLMTKENKERGEGTEQWRSREETDVILSRTSPSPPTSRECVFERCPILINELPS